MKKLIFSLLLATSVVPTTTLSLTNEGHPTLSDETSKKRTPGSLKDLDQKNDNNKAEKEKTSTLHKTLKYTFIVGTVTIVVGATLWKLISKSK